MQYNQNLHRGYPQASFFHYYSMFCRHPLWVMPEYKLLVVFLFVQFATEYLRIGWHYYVDRAASA